MARKLHFGTDATSISIAHFTVYRALFMYVTTIPGHRLYFRRPCFIGENIKAKDG